MAKFIKLTFVGGENTEPMIFNIDHISSVEIYHREPNSQVFTSNGIGYEVKESLEEIEGLLSANGGVYRSLNQLNNAGN